MSHLPALNDASLADLSLVDADDDDSPPLRTNPVPHPLGLPPPSRSVSGSSAASASASASASGFSGTSSFGAPSSRSNALSSDTERARPRFSLFAPGASGTRSVSGKLGGVEGSDGDETVRYVGSEEEDETAGEGQDNEAEEEVQRETVDPKARDESLRASLTELKKFNAVFDGFYSSLQAAREHNERLAARVAETHALFDQYVAMHGQALHTREMILNPNWTGASDDALALYAAAVAKQEAEERARREAEAAAAAAEEAAAERQREAERVAAARGRGRGRGGGGPRGRGTHTGIPTRSTRPTSAAGRPGSAAGRWGHVQSSGYGPRRS